MDTDELKRWRHAGKLAAEALEFGRKLIKPGASVKNIADAIDQKIIALGAKPAWPTQVSCDAIAAHYTPGAEDDIILDKHVVKLDVGVHVDGIIGDNATTVDLSGKHAELLAASRDALDAAIKVVRAGATLSQIGRAVQEAISKRGFTPIRNLTGHGISRWVIHDTPPIPNIDTKEDEELAAGQIIAIEPFATTGGGMVWEKGTNELFSLIQKKPVRSPMAREVLAHIEQEYNTVPFCTRWLVAKFGAGKTRFALRELLAAGLLHEHPPLVEKTGGLVSVFEHTLHVTEKGCDVLTRLS